MKDMRVLIYQFNNSRIFRDVCELHLHHRREREEEICKSDDQFFEEDLLLAVFWVLINPLYIWVQQQQSLRFLIIVQSRLERNQSTK
jgi:hypothetical protein